MSFGGLKFNTAVQQRKRGNSSCIAIVSAIEKGSKPTVLAFGFGLEKDYVSSNCCFGKWLKLLVIVLVC